MLDMPASKPPHATITSQSGTKGALGKWMLGYFKAISASVGLQEVMHPGVRG